MLNKLVSKTLESGEEVISYSPRRLAKSYYCGVAGYHDRYSPGSPMTGGIQFGLKVDQNISNFISTKMETSQIGKELEFFVFNTPPTDTETKPGADLVMTYKVPGTNYIVHLAGIADVLYKTRVVEIKTGKPKDWHRVQALSYACITGLPCQIIYVTRNYSIYVEPDMEELLRITRVCIENEIGKTSSKCEHCSFCSLKPMCREFTSDNNYLRVLCSLKTLVDSTEDKKLKKKAQATLKEYTRLANDQISPDSVYEYGGYTIRTRSRKDNPSEIGSIIFRKKEYFTSI